jgi:hypothetical protein
MLKQLMICAAFVAVGTASVNAEQKAVVLRKVEVPGADFDIVFAASRPHAAAVGRPVAGDPLVIDPIGGEFAYALKGEVEDMFKEVGVPLLPIYAFRLELHGGNARNALNVYVVPKIGPPMQ